jgi:hypothetical protein
MRLSTKSPSSPGRGSVLPQHLKRLRTRRMAQPLRWLGFVLSGGRPPRIYHWKLIVTTLSFLISFKSAGRHATLIGPGLKARLPPNTLKL